MSAGVPPELMQKHCGMTVQVRASAAGSNAGDEESREQALDVQMAARQAAPNVTAGAASAASVVCDNPGAGAGPLVYRGLDPVALESQNGVGASVGREFSDARSSCGVLLQPSSSPWGVATVFGTSEVSKGSPLQLISACLMSSFAQMVRYRRLHWPWSILGFAVCVGQRD